MQAFIDYMNSTVALHVILVVLETLAVLVPVLIGMAYATYPTAN